MIVIVMGVSGSGKTTFSRALAAALALPYLEGDDFHPAANVTKMQEGLPLTDEDRAPWLAALHAALLTAETRGGSVLACSALRAGYRNTLASGLSAKPTFVYLYADRATLLARLEGRAGHFFPATLLDSQLATLEPPDEAIDVDVTQPLHDTVNRVVEQLRAPGPKTPL